MEKIINKLAAISSRLPPIIVGVIIVLLVFLAVSALFGFFSLMYYLITTFKWVGTALVLICLVFGAALAPASIIKEDRERGITKW